MLKFMKSLYRILGRNSKTIKFLFYLSYVGLVTLFFVSPFMYNNMEWVRPIFRELGGKFGQASVILLVISMTPGILKRLGILDMVEAITLLFRREFGILAFYTTLMHVGYASWTRKMATGAINYWSIFDSQLEGAIAFSIFFVLFVISNDYSMKLLKHWWKYIQRGAYIAAILILLHVLAVGGSNWVIYLINFYLGAEVISWLWVWSRKMKPNTAQKPLEKTQK